VIRLSVVQRRRYSIVELIRRVWWRLRGEQPLLSTFWPQDYPRGRYVTSNEQTYQITRTVHAQDDRCFEVWGRAVPGRNASDTR
jgi:hypothetical protein